jgi:hypothetical protein
VHRDTNRAVHFRDGGLCNSAQSHWFRTRRSDATRPAGNALGGFNMSAEEDLLVEQDLGLFEQTLKPLHQATYNAQHYALRAQLAALDDHALSRLSFYLGYIDPGRQIEVEEAWRRVRKIDAKGAGDWRVRDWKVAIADILAKLPSRVLEDLREQINGDWCAIHVLHSRIQAELDRRRVRSAKGLHGKLGCWLTVTFDLPAYAPRDNMMDHGDIWAGWILTAGGLLWLGLAYWLQSDMWLGILIGLAAYPVGRAVALWGLDTLWLRFHGRNQEKQLRQIAAEVKAAWAAADEEQAALLRKTEDKL